MMNYSKTKLRGKVQTVSGLISPDEMGITLSHEHCLYDSMCIFNEPKEEASEKAAYEPVSFKNVGFIRYHGLDYRDNLLLLNEEQAIGELMLFRRAGGGTVVDMTNVDIGRDPLALRRISQSTGLNIVMGSGYYVKVSQSLEVMGTRTEESIADEIIRDILDGVNETGIRSGVIGEIGCSWPLEDSERRVLRAAGMAQRETGAPLVVHPGRYEKAPKEIIKILKEIGGDLSHTVISHIDRTLFEPENRYALADEGCYLAYDEWGFEGYYPESLSVTDILNDTQRIAQIKDLVAKGYSSQILISHDICQKCRYLAFGGHGYIHILYNAMPVMRRRGMSEELINDLLIENPKGFFVFK